MLHKQNKSLITCMRILVHPLGSYNNKKEYQQPPTNRLAGEHVGPSMFGACIPSPVYHYHASASLPNVPDIIFLQNSKHLFGTTFATSDLNSIKISKYLGSEHRELGGLG